MNQETGIAIVGAGPSGSYAAWKLASNGLQPIVLEEHPTPGYPEHCTGHVPTHLLEKLRPKPPHNLIQNKFKGVILHLPDNIELRVSFRNLTTCLIDRVLFDSWLAREAIKKGAAYLFSSRVEDASFKDKKVKLKVRDIRSKGDRILCTRILIDGEGAPPKLLRKMDFGEVSNLRFVNAVQGWFTDVKDIERDFIEVYLTEIYAYPFYAWVAPIGKDSAKVGLATAGDPVQMLRDLLGRDKRISRRFRDAYKVRFIGHPIPLGPPILENRWGVIPVGDAAAHVKPITGGGIALSLLFASLSADVIINSHGSIDHIGRRYPATVKEYVPYFKAMGSMRDLLYSMGERELTSMMKRFWSAGILPELVESVYPEAGLDHKLFIKYLRGRGLIWLLYAVSHLLCSAPKPFLKLVCSAIPYLVKGLPPLELHPKGQIPNGLG
ncbi:MAG: NAD(P)/FAD-dependent oxidoreductase [Candidatus Bathyarchaeia archaeon]